MCRPLFLYVLCLMALSYLYLPPSVLFPSPFPLSLSANLTGGSTDSAQWSRNTWRCALRRTRKRLRRRSSRAPNWSRAPRSVLWARLWRSFWGGPSSVRRPPIRRATGMKNSANFGLTRVTGISTMRRDITATFGPMTPASVSKAGLVTLTHSHLFLETGSSCLPHQRHDVAFNIWALKGRRCGVENEYWMIVLYLWVVRY